MNVRERSQRRAFDRQLRRLGRDGNEEARGLVAALTSDMKDDLYQASIDRFVSQGGGKVVAYDGDSQTPILDKLIEFFQWLWESGALLEIIKLFFGGLMEADNDVVTFYAEVTNGCSGT